MINEYYVYHYIDPFNNEVFYVGQGKGKRYMCHLKAVIQNKVNDYEGISNQKFKRIKQIVDSGLEPIIVKTNENLSKDEALFIEHAMILSYGRVDLGTGRLLNLTNGYEFTHNAKYIQPSPAAISEGKKRFYESEEGQKNKEYLSSLYKGVKIGSPEEWLGEERGSALRKIRSINAKNNPNFLYQDIIGEKNPFYGKTHTDETKQKIREARTGSNVSDETKSKISKGLKERGAHKGRNNYQAVKIEVTLPNGEIEIVNGNLCDFGKRHKMSHVRIQELCKGERAEYKGYKAKYI
jgi:hypothetical protein